MVGTKKNNALTLAEEELIVTALQFLSDCGFPLSRRQVKDMVQSYISSVRRRSVFSGGHPGKDWMLAFETHHREALHLRQREALSKSRADGLTEEAVKNFFEDVYMPLLDEHELWGKPGCIWNTDETGFKADKASEKVLITRGAKHAYSRDGMDKSMFTVLFYVCGWRKTSLLSYCQG